MQKKLIITYDNETGAMRYENPDDLTTFEALGMVECFKGKLLLDKIREAEDDKP